MAKQKSLSLDEIKLQSTKLLTSDQIDLKDFLQKELDGKAAMAKAEFDMISKNGQKTS